MSSLFGDYFDIVSNVARFPRQLFSLLLMCVSVVILKIFFLHYAFACLTVSLSHSDDFLAPATGKGCRKYPNSDYFHFQ